MRSPTKGDRVGQRITASFSARRRTVEAVAAIKECMEYGVNPGKRSSNKRRVIEPGAENDLIYRCSFSAHSASS
ncbi:hypothetical protein E2553_36640 [Paraburkholderia dipogonis]|uniref:Uncharacterized protein n=1 Tax=Paraburkholderia dipogonis TaxID=1211383 RepID=A0A4Y8MXW3_9BURK|nr:hypothetical protein [Paraburkholderia dipogonis]TFE42133.1 hypothetical protein E2553_36640 [Paraburkholderia dipogonis]